MTETEFHAQRRIFVVLRVDPLDQVVVVADPSQPRSHEEWFAQWVESEDEPRPSIEGNVRGYFDATGIYFYRGADFHGGPEVERVAILSISNLREFIIWSRMPLKARTLPVFVGVRVGIPGERWEPLQRLQV